MLVAVGSSLSVEPTERKNASLSAETTMTNIVERRVLRQIAKHDQLTAPFSDEYAHLLENFRSQLG